MNLTMFPCDRGTGGMGVGYHHYEVGATGTPCCVYCGSVPRAKVTWLAATPQREPHSASPDNPSSCTMSVYPNPTAMVWN